MQARGCGLQPHLGAQQPACRHARRIRRHATTCVPGGRPGMAGQPARHGRQRRTAAAAGPPEQGPQAHHIDAAEGCDREDGTSTASTSGRADEAASPKPRLTREVMAAMALSPIAALALPMATDPAWRESASGFGAALAARVQAAARTDEAQRAWAGLGGGATYMDWAWQALGVDLSLVWDPELWVKLQQAVVWREPNFFWNSLMDRVQYRDKVPQAGLVGDMRLSYAKFLALLEGRRIKRIIVYGDMRTAVVEVPHPWCASMAGAPGAYPTLEAGGDGGRPFGVLVPDPAHPDDPSRWWSPELAEWDMEKYRFYVDLPGDFWDSGALLDWLKEHMVQVVWDPASRQYLLPHRHLTRQGEVRTELQVLDASDSWDFLSWMFTRERMEWYEKAAALALFIRGVAVAVNIITSTALVRYLRKRTKKKSKKESTWERLTRAPAKEYMGRGKDGKGDTGVRFADIAGMDDLVFEMRELVKMMLGDAAYSRVGAKPPKGIIFQGPPGTGKTYLARAIAGEAGITFLSAVGSEFVEMFQGVAAARVNSLYYTARKKAPCIIFIDEVDAIGRSRTNLGSDPGSMERESALLAMLVQMDGIHGDLEQVLTIGATNLASDLDQALLRPGRFEAVYEIPTPNPVARLEILKYHARNKPLADPEMLVRVAEVTQGWSAAALANLMNEAAILTVRRGVDKISLPMVLDVVNAQEWGVAAPRIPPSEAKDRLALVTAAKAVAFALTPGLDPIQAVTLWSQRRGQGPMVQFLESGMNLEEAWHPEQVEIMDRATHYKVNAAEVGAEPLGEFLHVAGLLVPFYTGRALELDMFGADGCSLATAGPLADCFELAYYCVRNSTLHPKYRRLPPLHTYIWLGHDDRWSNQRDPLALGLDDQLGYHKLTLTLLKASWRRTQKLVAERRSAIVKVAEELLAAKDERITGSRLVEIVESTPLDASDIEIDSDFLPLLKEVLGNVPGLVADAAAAGGGAEGGAANPALEVDDETLASVSRAIMGRLDVVDLVGRHTAEEVAERVRESLLHPETVERLKAVRQWVEAAGSPFPPAPGLGGVAVPAPIYGWLPMGLEWWRQRNIDTITWDALDLLCRDPAVAQHYRRDQPQYEGPRIRAEKEAQEQQQQQQGQGGSSA